MKVFVCSETFYTHSYPRPIHSSPCRWTLHAILSIHGSHPLNKCPCLRESTWHSNRLESLLLERCIANAQTGLILTDPHMPSASASLSRDRGTRAPRMGCRTSCVLCQKGNPWLVFQVLLRNPGVGGIAAFGGNPPGLVSIGILGIIGIVSSFGAFR